MGAARERLPQGRCCSSIQESGTPIEPTSRLRRTWCSRDCPVCGAAPGACESGSGSNPSGRVPNRKDATVLIAPQDAERGYIEVEGTSRFDVQLHPGDCHSAEEVA